MHARQHRPSPDRRQPDPGPLSPASRAPAVPRRHPCLAPLPAPLGLRFRVLLGLGFVPPPEPRPCAHCVSIAYALLPAARVPLCRHRADPESSSRSLPSGSPARIAPHRAHRSHRAHRAPPPAPPPRVASAPGPWLARIAPHASLFRRMREKGPLSGNIRSKCMLFEIKMAISSPHASIPGRNRAIQDTWRANLAAKGPLSRRGTRNHAWREDVASAARPFRGSGLRSGRTGFAPCGSGMRHAAWPNGLCALRRGPGLLAACAPCHLACARRRPRSSPPSYMRRASPPASRPRTQPSAKPPIAVGVSRRSDSSCRPRAAHADASRPPMRARRHRLGPNPRQPGPSPAPTESRPQANRVSSTRGAVCSHPRPATRRASPCRAGSAAVLVIPAKWCGDTIAHTRKLRF